jgi:hypothetical protein
MQLYYGLTSATQIKEIAREVTRALGGNDAVYSQIVEIACVETQMGTYPDSHPEKWGVGVCQHDQINIDDLRLHAKQRDVDILMNEWGIDMLAIKLADLAYNPLLSIICCRLSLKRIPDPIPNDLYGRACYWKEYYNTRAGKGTTDKYLESVTQCLGEEWQ